MKSICKNCNYSFEGKNIKKCGFYGMDCVEEERSASELLEEVEKLLGG